MAIVEIINLTKSFKDIEVIHNTSFYLNNRATTFSFCLAGGKKGEGILKSEES